MILTVHLLAGVAAGVKIGNPAAAAAVALGSHFLLDAIPHKEYQVEALKRGQFNREFLKDLAKVGADFSVGLALAIFFAFFASIESLFWPVASAAFFAVLPDFLSFLYFLRRGPILEKIYRFHHLIHFLSRREISPRQKTAFQVFAAVVLFLIPFTF